MKKNNVVQGKTFVSLISAFLFLILATSCQKNDLLRAEILSSNQWKTTVVRDNAGADVTAANQGYVGLATYRNDGTYEFFNLDGSSRNDRGYWALTIDNMKRIINSTTQNYTRVVDITELTPDLFIYQVVNSAGKTVTVEHVPVR